MIDPASGGGVRRAQLFTGAMQVPLTPRGEELLRAALAQHPGQSPAQIVEDLLAKEVEGGGLAGPPDRVWQKLNAMPGVRPPKHWPPHFEKFEPIVIEGEPISEQLIRDRR